MNPFKDIWTVILSFIENNVDKFNLLISCKMIMQCPFTFNQAIHFFKIIDSSLFDKFTHVVVRNFNAIDKFPQLVEKIDILSYGARRTHYWTHHLIVQDDCPARYFFRSPPSVKQVHIIYRLDFNYKKPYTKVDMLWCEDTYRKTIKMIPTSADKLMLSLEFVDGVLNQSFQYAKIRDPTSFPIIFRMLA